MSVENIGVFGFHYEFTDSRVGAVGFLLEHVFVKDAAEVVIGGGVGKSCCCQR